MCLEDQEIVLSLIKKIYLSKYLIVKKENKDKKTLIITNYKLPEMEKTLNFLQKNSITFTVLDGFITVKEHGIYILDSKLTSIIF